MGEKEWFVIQWIEAHKAWVMICQPMKPFEAAKEVYDRNPGSVICETIYG